MMRHTCRALQYAGGVAPSAVGPKYLWSFSTASGWVTMDKNVCDQLTQAKQNGQSSITLRSKSCTYDFDLDAMKQVNTNSGRVRKLSAEPLRASSPRQQQAAGGVPPSTVPRKVQRQTAISELHQAMVVPSQKAILSMLQSMSQTNRCVLPAQWTTGCSTFNILRPSDKTWVLFKIAQLIGRPCGPFSAPRGLSAISSRKPEVQEAVRELRAHFQSQCTSRESKKKVIALITETMGKMVDDNTATRCAMTPPNACPTFDALSPSAQLIALRDVLATLRPNVKSKNKK